MDKETIEKLAEARLAYILLNWKNNWDNTTMTVDKLAQILIKVLKEEFGYRKISGEPPVLSDEEMGDLLDLEKEFTYPCSDGSRTSTIDCHKVAKTQRDADVRYYKQEA